MSEAVEIFGKSYGVFEMSHKDKAVAWIQNAPEADIHIGRFTLKFYFTAHRDWTWGWDFKRWLTPDEYRGSPEHNYLDRILDGLDVSYYEIEFIDELIEAMQAKPFNQGENYEI
jgi:hypothetical protein